VKDSWIFVFTGTSGSGRKTIAHRTGSELGLTHVISCTTRQRREKELTDRDYHYLTGEEFEAVAQSGGFAQMTTIDKERYGIRKSDLDEALSGGNSVYLILNKEGASAIKSLYGDRVIRLFLYVDKQTVRERLEAKGTRYSVIESYLNHYPEEVLYRKQCEHVFENVEISRTLAALRTAFKDYVTAGN